MSQQCRTNRGNNPNGYPPPLPNETEVQFIEACGLRRSELLNLRVRDIRQDEEGRMWIHVAKSAGKNEREVPVLAGNEKKMLAFLQNVRLFPSFPEQVDVLLARKLYARILMTKALQSAASSSTRHTNAGQHCQSRRRGPSTAKRQTQSIHAARSAPTEEKSFSLSGPILLEKFGEDLIHERSQVFSLHGRQAAENPRADHDMVEFVEAGPAYGEYPSAKTEQ